MQTFTTALEAADWVQGKRYASSKNGLKNIEALLAALGNPEKQLRCIHIAGTNGKGSVSAMTERALRACGMKTGLYTSPYLTQYSDRMRVNGRPMPDETLIRLTTRLAAVVEELLPQEIYPTAFELGTALAFSYFAEEHVDFAIIEVGIGGKLDSTNVITPAVSAIATIGLDHTALLGDTLPAIAAEKAGIIKPGVPCVATAQAEEVMEVFRRVAAGNSAPLTLVERPEVVSRDAYGSSFIVDGETVRISLPGDYQVQNAALSFAILRSLRQQGFDLPMANILQGLSLARWPARLTWVGNVLIDGAHNPQGADALVSYINEFFADTPRILVTAMMQDKDFSACAHRYAQAFDDIICTQIDYYRCATADMMAAAFADVGKSAQTIPAIPAAIEKAREMAGENGIVVIAGSLYLAGDAIAAIAPDIGMQL